MAIDDPRIRPVIAEASRCCPLPLAALLVAAVMNLLNLFEPLTVDDVCHHYYAAQVAKEPLRPFEFEVDWHQKPVPAWDVMVAPVNSYYWAPAIVMFGDSPTAWHLWYLPVQWLFCYSLLLLLRRFARPHAVAMMAAIALGPTILPGINLMLEVPMLALALSSLVAIQAAFDRRSLWFALLAGCLFGLALQTKYSAMGFFAPWLLLGVLRRRPRETLVGVAAAVAVALGIEGLVSLSHGGGSYFMRQLEETQRRDWQHIVRGMFLQVGVLGMPTAFLALCCLGAARRWGWLVLLVWVSGHLVVALVPDLDQRTLLEGAIDSIAYVSMALCTWGIAAATYGWLLLTTIRRLRAGRRDRTTVAALFFGLWFPAEIAASLVVSPFPAARRVLMVVFAFTCTAAWLAARRRHARAAVRATTIASIALGVVYQGIDHLEGHAMVRAAAAAVAHARAVDPKAEIYFTGGWGFEFYAPRAGMKSLARGKVTVQQGDFVVIGSIDGSEEPWFEWTGKLTDDRVELGFGDDVPFSTLFGYYSGRRPLENQHGARFYVWIFRARETFHSGELTSRPNPWRNH